MQRPIVLCDLDGTLADCSHRLHHIQKQPKDWPAFFAACADDAPINSLIGLLAALVNVEIWIVSGRSDEVSSPTEEWLRRHNVCCDRLIMRRQGDHTDDAELKIRWLTDGTIPRERVLLALEDRDRVVKAWRAAGITCLQVAEGAF